ncbi:alpha-hydroxy-acid oxidizing protein [Roseofilum reptotaenium CS-1145]|uniref:FMN-dependent dehydrogenase domain-containing protein n=1 Tax=Roseofilum reptotaenium AO1-A TaxID=1925591 RepID=A0A1L9QUX4_9CYAN|nr:alpha-hydroxy-acid oxidizing protein [Roseofilum reptotaenium CS-1145]OJJ26480.1 hypothetical protein BI308_06430 [Roseofilum reptotaenium AO1-A]
MVGGKAFAYQHGRERLFHHEGERAIARADAKYSTMFRGSSLVTITVEEIAEIANTPKMFQFYFNKVLSCHNYEQ